MTRENWREAVAEIQQTTRPATARNTDLPLLQELHFRKTCPSSLLLSGCKPRSRWPAAHQP